MQVSQEKLLQYIHFNRQYNTLLIDHNTKLIEQLRTEMETTTTTTTTTTTLPPGSVKVLVRKKVDNPANFDFDKTFAEYQQGFKANGEI